jgi:uncharacterized membrane protein YfcA
MECFLICIVAFLGSGLTLFSGFGLGTLLVPAFGIFFPIDIAITLTAIVHFLNNIFKLALLGKHADKSIILKFGIPSVFSAFAGAYILAFLSGLPVIFQYSLFDEIISIRPVKLTIACLLIFFSAFEIVPQLANFKFDKKYLPMGGLLSGFFGGLSGNQGALRSAFLIKAGLSKEAFIASGVAIACMVDISRLYVYLKPIKGIAAQANFSIIIASTLAAFAGAYLGNRLIKKITVKTLQYIVSVFLFVFSLLLGMGIL